MNILLIEDEKKVAQALSQGLQFEGYQVKIACSGEEGYFLLASENFDLVILDLRLPGRDGLEVLQTLRKSHRHLPVIILTARDTLEDKIRGLDLGADDYVVKPFAFPELAARIRALLRRGQADGNKLPVQLRLADLELDLSTRVVRRSQQVIQLTRREFELLEYLLGHQGHVVTREMLARDVWKVRERATPLDNVIDVHIARLRKKIDEPYPRKLLQTVRGVGFILTDEENQTGEK